MKWFRLLSQPFPEDKDFKKHLQLSLVISLFVTAFLYLLRPFDLHTAPSSSVAIYAVQFGLVTFLVHVLFELFLVKVLRVGRDLPSWTMGRWLLATVGIILCIAIGNYFLFLSITDSPYSVGAFFTMIGATLIVAVFPVVFVGGLKVQRLLLTNTQIASTINADLEEATGHSSDECDIEQTVEGIPVFDIYYIEALQNYVRLHYLMDGGYKTTTKRSTLKDIEGKLSGTSMVRCHRSYIVNKNHLENVSGNAQGFQLTLHGVRESTIPVSRKYIPVIKA